MTVFVIFCTYLLLGFVLAKRHVREISADAVGRDPVLTALRWVITWPLWAFKR